MEALAYSYLKSTQTIMQEELNGTSQRCRNFREAEPPIVDPSQRKLLASQQTKPTEVTKPTSLQIQKRISTARCSLKIAHPTVVGMQSDAM